jgi:RNA polymerase sigma-70 factor (ECF subfamily)
MVAEASMPRVAGTTVEELSFDGFYRAEYPRVVRLAWSLTGRRAVAEELAQDAFLEAHRRWSTVSRYEQPGAWLRRVVVNRSLSSLRRRSTEARLLLRLSRLRQPADDEIPEDSRALWQAVRRLPRRQAEVVALIVIEDLSAEEAATVLGCGVETVRTHYRRARLALVDALDDAIAVFETEGGSDAAG